LWQRETSPSGRFAILFFDGDDRGISGHRTSGHGRWRLLDGQRVLAEGRLERPNDAKVADDGTFVIADWLFTDDLAGRFYAFDASGTVVISEQFGANILDTYLAPDGRYAAVTCASNPKDETYDERFTLYDLSARRRLWFKALEIGRATGVEFDIPHGKLTITSEGFGRTEYELLDGSVDLATVRESAFTHGDGFTILTMVEEMLAEHPSPTAAESRRLVAACDRAAGKLAKYPNWAAKAHRHAGEILLGQGDEAGALVRWQQALGLDPKVGIKKRADALAARLGQL
jgi:hypothetical protein